MRHGRSAFTGCAIGGDPPAGVLDARGPAVARPDRSGTALGVTCGAKWSRSRGTVRSVEVRDLFERFIPEGERVKRLGDVVDRSAILALRGDAARGRLIFTTNPAAQCKTCHKAGDVGENVGPDLTKIGAKYNKPALLDQILEPSKTIDPQYISYLVETKDGRVLSGLVVERTKDAVVLKDAQGKTIKVPQAKSSGWHLSRAR